MAKKKYIESPERMWELFQEYVSNIRGNPIYLVEQKKGNTSIKLSSDAEGNINFKPPSDLVEIPARRPLTLEGFENYVADQDIIQDLGHYFANTDGNYKDYCTICSRIRRVIRQDQIEGGMVGIYNPSITQRLNSLVDKSETVVKEQPLFPEND